VTFVLEALFPAYVVVLFEKIVSGTCCESGGAKINFHFILSHAHSN
jgi:hypothetical protein